jgi:hypothetical protein
MSPGWVWRDHGGISWRWGVSWSSAVPGRIPGGASRRPKLVHSLRELDSPDEALAEFGGVVIHVDPAAACPDLIAVVERWRLVDELQPHVVAETRE